MNPAKVVDVRCRLGLRFSAGQKITHPAEKLAGVDIVLLPAVGKEARGRQGDHDAFEQLGLVVDAMVHPVSEPCEAG